jgi:DNA adenine methylase
MSYLGSKAASGAYQAIIALMPPHDTYIETHLGTGAIMSHKPPATCSIGIDLDSDMLEQYRSEQAIELLCMDAVTALEDFDYESAGRTLIYVDPPYLHSTRTSRKRYKYEYTRADHIRLISCLKRLPANVILSGYPSALYDELLPTWHTVEFQVMTRGGVRTEKLWLNYKPDSAHWATFAGRNFTDRQRIKRKARRWAHNFEQLPAAERLAVMAALLEVSKKEE